MSEMLFSLLNPTEIGPHIGDCGDPRFRQLINRTRTASSLPAHACKHTETHTPNPAPNPVSHTPALFGRRSESCAAAVFAAAAVLGGARRKAALVRTHAAGGLRGVPNGGAALMERCDP
jgi:hypothetical protein